MKFNNDEIFFVDYENDSQKTLLYAPLRSYLGLISSKIKEHLINEPNGVYGNQLQQVLNQRKLIDLRNIHAEIQKSIPELSLALTDDCSLNCLYCHASAGESHKKGSMSFKMIDSILNSYFEKLTMTKTRIVFAGGGEPTYDLVKLDYAITKCKDLARNKGIEVTFRMATNGYYGNKIRNYIMENFSEVSLSFDGPDFIQNKQRPTKSFSPSYPIVYETAQYFKSNNFSFAIRATISNYSLEHIIEIVDFVSSNFPNTSLALEPLNPYGRGLNCELKPPDKLKFAEFIVKAYEHAENKPIKMVNACVGGFENLRTIFCGAVGVPNYTINTKGHVSCCTRDNAPEEFNFGYYNVKEQKFYLDDSKINKIKAMNVYSYQECDDCFCKYHCAGDCPDLRISNLHNCDFTKKLGVYFLNKKIQTI